MAAYLNYKKLNKEAKLIAKKRIYTLFEKADEKFDTDRQLANRYVALARKLSMKYKVSIPSGLKRKFCKHCYSYLKPGVNLRVRTHDGKLVYYCLECKRFWRMPLLVKSKK